MRTLETTVARDDGQYHLFGSSMLYVVRLEALYIEYYTKVYSREARYDLN